MSHKDEPRNNKKARRCKPAKEKEKHEHTQAKHDWKGFFEDVTYSSGPGDNVFVFG